MNYLAIYNSLIGRSIGRSIEGYTERHHIIPKCMGGSNDPTNIAVLTPEEHFLAHQLLVRIHPEVPSLIVAARIMTRSKDGRRVNNRLFGWLKRGYAEYNSKLHSGKKLSEEHKRKLIESHSTIPKTARQMDHIRTLGKSNLGRKATDEVREKLSNIQKARGRSEEEIDKIRELGRNNKGKVMSAETRAKMSAARKGKPMSEEGKELRRKYMLERIARKKAETDGV